ncbi:MAG: DUF362 domain-containing protein [Desulfarculaceae bacterium]|nr:DUF362 domain-containing protein [Desulfarculaceae bacterium]MCF8070763.1 DUF362 domain-containing protein [Desulfarculaceae bacterium]MCF8102200.1 DUF362 domain-containing protein [Desulfarculaceae bacterium]MCF8117001.1 DUF362 domain-containing protein [Desulfarculaceae bacterium]
MAFDLFKPQVAGKKVLVKPNVLRGAKPEEGIATHPAVLRAVVERLEKMDPAEIIVGDNPGVFTYGANEQAFRDTGLMEAAKDYYRNIGAESKEVPFNPEYLPTVGVSKAIMEADLVISLPKFKTHGLTVLSGAIKNSFGILPGAQKANLHKLAGEPGRFNEVLVDVYRLREPDLFIMDGVLGMEGNGPASPDLREVGLVLAADNAVALDATVGRLMGLADPMVMRFLAKAHAEGLGEYAEEAIEIIGELNPVPDFKLPPLGGEGISRAPGIQEFIESRTELRPAVDEELCTSCGTCIEQCPASALAFDEEYPKVDPEKCIVCFCCQEMCPEKAIQLS